MALPSSKALTDIRTCPTFVINLDRRKDRWQEFSAQPTLKQFTTLDRFSAVEGAKLDPFTDKRISIHTRQNIVKNYRRSHYEINTLGAIGASLSHFTIWENFLKTDANHIVVFEDDTLVRDQDLALIDNLIPSLPDEWDMWVLGTHKWMLQGVPLSSDKTSWWKINQFTGAHAYVLSRRGAELLLQEPYPIETHVEFYICACSLLKGLRIIKHPLLRMTYSMESSTVNDSDTFESRLSCPVCYVPDNYPKVLYFFRKDGYMVRGVQLALLAALGYGAYKMWKHKKLA
jgi:hypothetical protein